MDEVRDLLALQHGVVARRQLLGCGLEAHDIRRLVRRRELVRVGPGVYVDHTGALTWPQKAWAAVLDLWPAALWGESALRAGDGPGRRGPEAPIHVAVDRNRSPAAPPAVHLHRVTNLEARVQWNLGPPRMRIEEAVLDVAAGSASEFDAVAAIADAVQARRTTADRLRSTLGERERVARRSFLEDVLDDVALGTCSVLERGYLRLVERPHGLPPPDRQASATSLAARSMFHDVEYARFRLVIELDGRLFHDGARSRSRDLRRDLAAATDGKQTVRLGWGQVFGHPCETAQQVVQLLQLRGWRGQLQPCPSCASSSGRYAGATG